MFCRLSPTAPRARVEGEEAAVCGLRCERGRGGRALRAVAHARRRQGGVVSVGAGEDWGRGGRALRSVAHARRRQGGVVSKLLLGYICGSFIVLYPITMGVLWEELGVNCLERFFIHNAGRTFLNKETNITSHKCHQLLQWFLDCTCFSMHHVHDIVLEQQKC